MQEFNPEINPSQVYKYLGYKGQKLDDTLLQNTVKAINECNSRLRLKYISKVFSLNKDMTLVGTDVRLEGDSIKSHLQGCESVVVMAATCGIDLDIAVNRLFVTNKALALLTDSAGSVAIEEYADYISSLYTKSTSRFSCGYGDFPLSANKEICRLLNTDKLIGLKATKDFLLSPKKSVTAIMGLDPKTKKDAPCDHNCANCSLSKCVYKK